MEPTAALGWVLAMDALARQGDERAAAALKESRRTRPEVWDSLSGVGHQAESAWLSLIQPDEIQYTAAREMLKHDIDRMRKRLLDGSDDPVDELLVSRIITTWLAATHSDMMLTNRRMASSASIRELEYFDGVADRAHRAHLRAIEALAKVQRLRRPSVQVNVGAVNVATVSSPAGEAAIGEGEQSLDLGVVEAEGVMVDRASIHPKR